MYLRPGRVNGAFVMAPSMDLQAQCAMLVGNRGNGEISLSEFNQVPLGLVRVIRSRNLEHFMQIELRHRVEL